jgi:perosamine synthetase
LVTEAVKSGWVSSKGKFIEEFEQRFAEYIGVKHGVAVSNGTVALHLALAASGIGPGDEVIVPDLTFVATINAVLYTGAKPVIVDVDEPYWCMNPQEFEAAITPKTKAVLPVHLYGHPCEMDQITEIAKKRGVLVIEDAAEASGAEYKGKKVGAFGLASCFSFYGNKIITTGEGGMCLTDNDELAVKMRILRDHGMNPNRQYWHDQVGFNYRMTNLQAALGTAQIRKIDRFVTKKRALAKQYHALLAGLEGLTLHPEMPWAKSVYWLYSIIADSKTVSRNQLMTHLAGEGIESRPFFYPLHEMPIYSKFCPKDCPSASKLSRTGLSLPSSVKLTTADVSYVAQALRRIIE